MTLAERLEVEGATSELVRQVAQLEQRAALLDAHVRGFVFGLGHLVAEDLLASLESTVGGDQ